MPVTIDSRLDGSQRQHLCRRNQYRDDKAPVRRVFNRTKETTAIKDFHHCP